MVLHLYKHTYLIIKLKPEIAVFVGLEFGVTVSQSVFSLNLLVKSLLLLRQPKYEVVLYKPRLAHSSLTDIVLVHPDDAVVRRETDLGVGSQHSDLVVCDVKQVVALECDSVIVDVFLPVREVWHCSHGHGPLGSDESARWVLEVHRDKKAVQHFVVVSDNIRLHSRHD